MFGMIFLLLQTYFAFIKPRWFIVSYFLYTSSFLGFFSRSFFVAGFDIALFYQSFLMIVIYFLRFQKQKYISKKLRYLLYVLICLYVYALILPVAIGYSTIFQSIVASKEFSVIFLLHYLSVHREDLDSRFLYQSLRAFSLFFLLILTTFLVFGSVPPFYSKTGGRIEFFHPTLVSLYLFIKSGAAVTFRQKLKVCILIVVWTAVMIPNDHTAILLSTTAGCLFLVFRVKVLWFLSTARTVLMGVVMLTALYYVSPVDKAISWVAESSSFQSRQIYNAPRIERIKERLFTGYGFLHKSSLTIDDSSVYSESLSFIDSGYVDLFGKFGLVGTIFYLLYITLYVLRFNSNDRLYLTMKAFIAQFLLVNITWSVFSFSMGLICIAIVVLLLERREQYLASYKSV